MFDPTSESDRQMMNEIAQEIEGAIGPRPEPKMEDGERYWLGACYGRYDAASDSFDLGNCFVHRSETVYVNCPAS